MGNVEYFEMCKISPNFQSLYCLTYCTKGKDRLHKKAGGTNEKIHPRTGWRWCFQPPQAHGGDQLTSGGTDRTGMNSDFFDFFFCRAYRACTAEAALTFRTREFFSRGSSLCLTKSHLHSLARHVWFMRTDA